MLVNRVSEQMQDLITLKSLPKMQELNDVKYDTQIANEGIIQETAKVGLETAKSIGNLQINMVKEMNDPIVVEFKKNSAKIKELVSTMLVLKNAGLDYNTIQAAIDALVLKLV